jgi:hypothetical protein
MVKRQSVVATEITATSAMQLRHQNNMAKNIACSRIIQAYHKQTWINERGRYFFKIKRNVSESKKIFIK